MVELVRARANSEHRIERIKDTPGLRLRNKLLPLVRYYAYVQVAQTEQNLWDEYLSLAETLQWIDRLKPKRAVITNMHFDLDYDTLRRELPPGVEPAHDGMELLI